LEFIPENLAEAAMIIYNSGSKLLVLIVKNDRSIGSIDVISSSGKLVATHITNDVTGSRHEIGMSLPAGIYFALWRDHMGNISGSGKFIVQN